MGWGFSHIKLLGLKLGVIGFPIFLTVVLTGQVESKPSRVVSLNLCTDQLLMMLADPQRIAALSYLARRPASSVMADQAINFAYSYGDAEDVIRHKPDLILAGTYSTRATVHLLRKLGKNVVEIAPAHGFDDIAINIRRIASAVGEEKRGERMIAAMQSSLRMMRKKNNATTPTAALIYTNSYTSGLNTLANKILEVGGFSNLAIRLGFSGSAKISLESLLIHKPDALILGRKSIGGRDQAHEIFYHPVLKKLLAQIPSITLQDKYWVCGTPYTLIGAERIRKFYKSVITASPSKE